MKDVKLSEHLKEVALLFLRLGATSFGGPAAYIGLMHHEIVVRRKWIDDQKFLVWGLAPREPDRPNIIKQAEKHTGQTGSNVNSISSQYPEAVQSALVRAFSILNILQRFIM